MRTQFSALTAALVGASLMLSACGKEASDPKTADEVIAEAGKLEHPRPGQYETKVELIDVSIPGLSPQIAEQMKARMGGAGNQSSAYCLTEDEAKKGFEETIRKMTDGGGSLTCNFDRFAVDGGKLDAALSCKGPQGMTSQIAIDGSATAESTAMHTVAVQKAPMIPGGEMRMEMTMNSQRVGDCP